jgi:hypothetical protein
LNLRLEHKSRPIADRAVFKQAHSVPCYNEAGVALRHGIEEGKAPPLAVVGGYQVVTKYERLIKRVRDVEIVTLRALHHPSISLNHGVRIQATRFRDAQHVPHPTPELHVWNASIFIDFPTATCPNLSSLTKIKALPSLL